ncbi:SDR family NAD(P)-dependent oxidoreductase [Sphingobacterium deserti]|uniref:Short-chain dehydrogenase/reductase SDR n=1 Tax=Sphingobacterium deserti TaxID=1229276 RepID=A0A0B8TCV5_9SPHI|nr:SDR family oxidoreductase [Sphingobacterium deserti]KGE16205.1 short-chain dehydrogenase/reductase SDR [Sphingobacterium deserti]
MKTNILSNTLKIALFAVGARIVMDKVIRQGKKQNLYGKVVLITGGSRGLGLALAQELVKKGAILALCARNEENLAQASASLQAAGGTVFTCVADVSQAEDVENMIASVIAEYGRIDVLINNAGAMIVGPEETMDIADYKQIMDTNCWSSLFTTKAILPHFRNRKVGHIVNIASIGGKLSVPHMLPYSVSKFALVGLSQGFSAELAKENVRVTTVVPSLMRTGSPRNIDVKGNHQSEYAWFKIADSLPLLSQHAAFAAKTIVEGIEERKRNITLGLNAKVAIALQALLPETTAIITEKIGAFLPSGTDKTTKKGYQSESWLTKTVTGFLADRSAKKFNQF